MYKILTKHICQNCNAEFYTLQPKQKCCSKKCTKQLWKKDIQKLGHTKYTSNIGRKKGSIPWNKNKKCLQLSGENNGFYNKKHTEETKEKIRKTSYNTKRKNNSFNTSQEEQTIYKYLLLKFKHVYTQYKSKKYPFNCDFYIPEKDLYIEYQGHWTHGIYNHEILGNYNPNNPKHQEILKIWRNKNTKYFNNAIYTWTILDPKKLQFIQKYNLNLIKFYSIREFMEWYDKLD